MIQNLQTIEQRAYKCVSKHINTSEARKDEEEVLLEPPFSCQWSTPDAGSTATLPYYILLNSNSIYLLTQNNRGVCKRD